MRFNHICLGIHIKEKLFLYSLLAEVVTEEIPFETGHRLITLWLQWESTNHIWLDMTGRPVNFLDKHNRLQVTFGFVTWIRCAPRRDGD